MLRLGERLDGFAQFVLEVVGQVQGSVSYLTNNYFDVFDLTRMLNIRKYFLRENVAQVVFRNIISTAIVCNEY